MTTIFLINNSLTMNNIVFPEKDSLEHKREKRILSIEGEEESKKLILDKDLKNVSSIYASSYVMSIGTAKYLAQKLGISIQIDDLIDEAKLGNLGDKKIRMVREMQENDFDYQLPNGESLNEVKTRMLKFLRNILKAEEGKTVAIFTHNVAITSLLSEYCKAGFNLDNRLILNYNEEAIVDGSWDGITIITMVFDNQQLVSIKRKK